MCVQKCGRMEGEVVVGVDKALFTIALGPHITSLVAETPTQQSVVAGAAASLSVQSGSIFTARVSC